MKSLSAPAGMPIAVCKDRQEITTALASFRHFRGVSQVALDDLAGWTDTYTSKLEQPFAEGTSGRRVGRCAMRKSFDEWLAALKVRVIIVPAEARITVTEGDGVQPELNLVLPPKPMQILAARKTVKAKRTKAMLRLEEEG